MNRLIEALVGRIVRRQLMELLTKLSAAISGYKTYLALWGGVLVMLVGYLTGGTTVGESQLPAFTGSQVVEAIWAALVGSFLRSGIAKSGPK
jgi:hypothetical protein